VGIELGKDARPHRFNIPIRKRNIRGPSSVPEAHHAPEQRVELSRNKRRQPRVAPLIS
jgi:hypothetical protein